MSLSVTIHPKASQVLHTTPETVSDFVRSCLEEHKRVLASKSRDVRKDSPESAVSLVEVPGFPRACVKEFRWRGWLHSLKGFFRPTQGLRTYENGWRLIEAGVRAASPLALIRERRFGVIRSEWVIMEVIPDALELDRYLVKKLGDGWLPGEKRELTVSFGRFIGSMHAAGVFHSDLKTCNILVSEHAVRGDGPPGAAQGSDPGSNPVPCPAHFSLLDYDDVTFSSEVPQRKRVKNLVQIFLSTPGAMNASDRLRFLGEYALHMGLNSRQRREMALEILEAARGRELLYVGFHGDLRENWERR